MKNTHELSDALREQEHAKRLTTRCTAEQSGAIDALLEAYGVETKDVAGFAMVAGQPLLVIHRTGPSRREGGIVIVDTEVRTLSAPCEYEDTETPLGLVPMCQIHDTNSRHDAKDSHRPCLAIDPCEPA